MKYAKFILLTGIILFFTGCKDSQENANETSNEQEEVSHEIDENYLEILNSKTDEMVPDFFDTIMMEMLEDDPATIKTAMGDIYKQVFKYAYDYHYFNPNSNRHKNAAAKLKEIIDNEGDILNLALFYGYTNNHQVIQLNNRPIQSDSMQLHVTNDANDRYDLVFGELGSTNNISLHPLGVISGNTIVPIFLSHALSPHGAQHTGQGHGDAHYVAHNLNLDTTDTEYVTFLNKVNAVTLPPAYHEESEDGPLEPDHFNGKLHCHEPGGRYPPGGGGCDPSEVMEEAPETMRYQQPMQDFNRAMANPHRQVPLTVILPVKEPGSEINNPTKIKKARLMGVTWLTQQDVIIDGNTVHMFWPVKPLYFGFDPVLLQ